MPPNPHKHTLTAYLHMLKNTTWRKRDICCCCCCWRWRYIDMWFPSISNFFGSKSNKYYVKKNLSDENGAPASNHGKNSMPNKTKTRAHAQAHASIYGILLFIRLICKRPHSKCHQTSCVKWLFFTGFVHDSNDLSLSLTPSTWWHHC